MAIAPCGVIRTRWRLVYGRAMWHQRAMTFATLYIDDGNLLDFHEDRDAARASVLSVVEEHPEIAEELGMVELDEYGHRIGEFVSGAELKAQAASATPSRAA